MVKLAEARTRNSAMVSPPDLSKYTFPPDPCFWASAAKLRVVTTTATSAAAYLYFMFSFRGVIAEVLVRGRKFSHTLLRGCALLIFLEQVAEALGGFLHTVGRGLAQIFGQI